MTKCVISEETIHYVAYLLEREKDRYPTTKHSNALKDMRDSSNSLLEHLGEPMTLNVYRHRNKDK